MNDFWHQLDDFIVYSVEELLAFEELVARTIILLSNAQKSTITTNEAPEFHADIMIRVPFPQN